MPNIIQAIRPEVNKTFPIPGFRIRTDISPAWAEIAIATAPDLLFDPTARSQRAQNNFFSSRVGGLTAIERGEAVYLLPPEIMERFVGQERLYYALAVYRQPTAVQPHITHLPAGATPYIRISSSYRGNTQGILGVPNPRGGLTSNGYTNGNQPVLEWGGDFMAPAAESVTTPDRHGQVGTGNGATSQNGVASNGNGGNQNGMNQQNGQFDGNHPMNGNGLAGTNGNNPAQGSQPAGLAFDYDDGYDPSLWSQAQSYVPTTSQPEMHQRNGGNGNGYGTNVNNGGGVAPPLAQPLALVQPNYLPSNPMEALAAIANFASRFARWRAGVPNTEIYPHSAICHFDVTFPNKRGIGTGFYIDTDRILTCAHNVRDVRNNSEASSILITPGKNGNSAPFGSFAVSRGDWEVHPSYDGTRDFDLAVIKVTTPPPNGFYFDALEDLTQSIQEPIVVCGYAAQMGDDNKQNLDGDTVRGVSDNLERIQYNLQTEPGNSGSPVFYATGAEDHGQQMSVPIFPIIGVHVSAYNESLNQACRLSTAKINWIRAVGRTSTAGAQTLGYAPNETQYRPQALANNAFDINWNDVQLVPQPTSMSCWAAAASMVVGWREQMSINPAEIARGSGFWSAYANGLFPSNRDDLANAWGLVKEPPQNYTVEGWRTLIENNGPLWVGVAVPSGHAVVVHGIYGDGTTEGTYVRVKDPWPVNQGSEYVRRLSDFVTEYENRITTDSSGNVNIQILHAGGRNVSAMALGNSRMQMNQNGNGHYAPTNYQYATEMHQMSDGSMGQHQRSYTQALALSAIDPASVERMKQAFITNVQQGSPQSCIVITNAGLRQLYGAYLQNDDGSNRRLGSTVQDTMAALQNYGLAGGQQDFEYNQASGARTLGTVRPHILAQSVESWLLAQADVNQMSGWYIFGLSIMDGYHSVILALSFNGIGDPNTRIFWADQIYTGWDDVTGSLDARLTERTQAWWDLVQREKGVGYRTRTIIWTLLPGAAAVSALGVHDTEDGIEGYEEEPEGIAQALDTRDVEACIASCSDGFCPVNYAATAGTAHFGMNEFRCRDGTDVPERFRGNVQQVMENLEVLRAELGNSPITINSGYRTCSYNCTLNGSATRSRHLCGQAADIRVSGYTPSDVHAAIERLISEGRMQEGGLGIYNTFVHYDVRGTRARWDRRR